VHVPHLLVPTIPRKGANPTRQLHALLSSLAPLVVTVSHEEHELEPTTGAYLPVSHERQKGDVVPAKDVCPIGQSRHALLPSPAV
jgi:hypothetical protein